MVTHMMKTTTIHTMNTTLNISLFSKTKKIPSFATSKITSYTGSTSYPSLTSPDVLSCPSSYTPPLLTSKKPHTESTYYTNVSKIIAIEHRYEDNHHQCSLLVRMTRYLSYHCYLPMMIAAVTYLEATSPPLSTIIVSMSYDELYSMSHPLNIPTKQVYSNIYMHQ